MPILYRYLIRETLAVFLATNLILLAILLSFRLSTLLAAAAAGNMALSAVWMLIGLQAVRFLVILMPLAFVLAAVMTLGRLYRDHEISAALACGIAPRHQTRALLAWNADHDPAHTTLFTYQDADLRLPGANTLAASSDNRLRNLPTSELGTSPEHLSEWQSRSNPAVALFIYALALPLLARSQPRQGRYQKIVPAFIAFALYINLLDLITIAIRKQQIPPLPGSYWLHGAVLALILICWQRSRGRA